MVINESQRCKRHEDFILRGLISVSHPVPIRVVLVGVVRGVYCTTQTSTSDRKIHTYPTIVSAELHITGHRGMYKREDLFTFIFIKKIQNSKVVFSYVTCVTFYK